MQTGNLNMFTLIAIGTGTAYLYSVVALFAPGLFPETFRGHHGTVAVYFEAAAVIIVLVLLGQVLELRARERPAPPFARCSTLHPRPRGASPPTAGRKRCLSTRSRSGIGCGCDPERKCRSTRRSWRAKARSTNPW